MSTSYFRTWVVDLGHIVYLFSSALCLFLFVWYIKSDSCGPCNKQCHSNLSFLHAWHPRSWWSFGKVIGCNWPTVRQNNEGQKHNAHDMDWNGLQSYFILQTPLRRTDCWKHCAYLWLFLLSLDGVFIKPLSSLSSHWIYSRSHQGVKRTSHYQMLQP